MLWKVSRQEADNESMENEVWRGVLQSQNRSLARHYKKKGLIGTQGWRSSDSGLLSWSLHLKKKGREEQVNKRAKQSKRPRSFWKRRDWRKTTRGKDLRKVRRGAAWRTGVLVELIGGFQRKTYRRWELECWVNSVLMSGKVSLSSWKRG